jgi:formylmethanofuran dehydrogenase subunit E
MKSSEIMEREDFKKCVEFHGHICPGLSIGYKASGAAMERLKEKRSEDEEIVAIIETDACSADAVQVLTGCTFGKGNFIYKDHGKMVLTLFSRNSGEGVRVAIKKGAFTLDPEHRDLMQKVMNGEAEEEAVKQFQSLHFQRSCDILEMPLDDLFDINSVNIPMPDKAKIEPSEPCDICGEPVMATKLVETDGRKICLACA